MCWECIDKIWFDPNVCNDMCICIDMLADCFKNISLDCFTKYINDLNFECRTFNCSCHFDY